MWVLIIIVSALGLPFPPTVAKVDSFYSLKECEDERIRITAEMDKAYPVEERHYVLECKPTKRLREKSL